MSLRFTTTAYGKGYRIIDEVRKEIAIRVACNTHELMARNASGDFQSHTIICKLTCPASARVACAHFVAALNKDPTIIDRVLHMTVEEADRLSSPVVNPEVFSIVNADDSHTIGSVNACVSCFDGGMFVSSGRKQFPRQVRCCLTGDRETRAKYIDKFVEAINSDNSIVKRLEHMSVDEIDALVGHSAKAKEPVVVNITINGRAFAVSEGDSLSIDITRTK